MNPAIQGFKLIVQHVFKLCVLWHTNMMWARNYVQDKRRLHMRTPHAIALPPRPLVSLR